MGQEALQVCPAFIPLDFQAPFTETLSHDEGCLDPVAVALTAGGRPIENRRLLVSRGADQNVLDQLKGGRSKSRPCSSNPAEAPTPKPGWFAAPTDVIFLRGINPSKPLRILAGH